MSGQTSDFSKRQTARHYESFSLAIAASGTNSASAIVQGFTTFSLFVPTIDGSAITFLGSQSSAGSFYTVTKNGTAVNMGNLAAAGSHLAMSASAFDSLAGLYAIKISASTAQTTGAVTFVLGAKA